MKIITWLSSALVLLGLIGGAGQVLAKKVVQHEIVIDAPIDTVWAVIADSASYAQWNPTLQLKSGTVAVGEKVTYQFTDSDGKQSDITAKVKEKTPNKVLHQSGGIPGIITYENYWRVEPINDNQTKVSMHEDYAGVYVWFWNTDSTEKAYELMNQALAKRASH